MRYKKEILRYKKEIIGSFLWAGILMFWWYSLYGHIEEKVTTVEELYLYTCSVTGIQAPFLHGTFYLFVYLMFLSQFMKEWRIEGLILQFRKEFFRKTIKILAGRTILFISVYALIYTICLLAVSEKYLLKKTAYFSTLCFYSVALCVFYLIMGHVFLIFSIHTGKKTISCVFTIIIAVGLLTVRYLLHWPTPYSCLDIFDMVYYKGRILLDVYVSRVSGNLILICFLEKIGERLFCKKDVWENEVL